jgi:PAS domain-containing protein
MCDRTGCKLENEAPRRSLAALEFRFAELSKELNCVKDALNEHAIVAITDRRGKIVFVNDKFCTMSQYSREELLKQDHRIINSGHHSKEFIRSLWASVRSGPKRRSARRCLSLAETAPHR